MQTRLTNNYAIPLSMALWLAVDEYDHVDDADYISVTSLTRSTRQLVLESRLEPTTAPALDISNLIRSRIGTAIHNSVEQAWVQEMRIEALRKLGYPEKIIQRIKINPLPGECTEEDLPVYLEQRTTREFMGRKIGGKFDMVTNGILSDIKTTSTWVYMNKSNDLKFKLQGSLYRWLNPEIITENYMYINYVFLDWKAGEYQSKKEQGYPQLDILAHKLDLLSVAETEIWVVNKLTELDRYMNEEETSLPPCSPADLWQSDPVYKYYKNPESTGRSTKNFNTLAEAQIRYINDGSVGKIVEAPGMCKACLTCKAYNLCTQKDLLISQGLLQI